jgi:hypothetical protein
VAQITGRPDADSIASMPAARPQPPNSEPLPDDTAGVTGMR